jgi:hypothetical protein
MNAQSGPVPVRTLAFLGAACFASMASLRAADPILPEIAVAAPVFDDTGGQPIFLAAGVLLLIVGAAFRSLLAYRD